MMKDRINKLLKEALTLFPELKDIPINLEIKDLGVFEAQIRRIQNDEGYVIFLDNEIATSANESELIVIFVHELSHLIVGMLPEDTMPRRSSDFPLIVFDEVAADFIALKRISLAYKEGKISRDVFSIAIRKFIVESYLSSILPCRDGLISVLKQLMKEAKVGSDSNLLIDISSLEKHPLATLVVLADLLDLWVNKKISVEMDMLVC